MKRADPQWRQGHAPSPAHVHQRQATGGQLRGRHPVV